MQRIFLSVALLISVSLYGSGFLGGGGGGDGSLGASVDLTAEVTGTLPTGNGGTGNTSGLAATATALASNPTDCGAGEFANAIAANGNLTCATPSGVGSWTSFTPTGSWSANTTYTGFYKLVGDDLHVKVNVATSGAPTSATLDINLPTGCTITTTKDFHVGDNGPVNLGDVSFANNGVAGYVGRVSFINSDTDSVRIQTLGAGASSVDLPSPCNASTPFSFGADDDVWIRFVVPATCS